MVDTLDQEQDNIGVGKKLKNGEFKRSYWRLKIAAWEHTAASAPLTHTPGGGAAFGAVGFRKGNLTPPLYSKFKLVRRLLSTWKDVVREHALSWV
ncbi:hypothetical protein HPP92_015908 [Vanilla planifolia]|uniref:Uncharacterized protein n=1 Tax=Vanilla planifolia TaxID=51239 RepID=A0A835QIS0_VANPL|nr:hypothetical protein HPP92_015908 [Vanilla planifolia]